ncbi:hypothetical protein GS461_21160 [Rhodococcus hoagii]|nr:hypothetical protein [Prescottella equi]
MEALSRAAADGLQFFATFVPRAAFVAERAGTGDTFPAYDEIEARYFEQNDIRLDALAADIDVVTRVAADIDQRCDDQERVRTAVAEAWQGHTSDAVDAHFAGHLERAARLQQDLADLRCALAEADRVLREAAARKAEWVASLDPTRACGRTVAEVDRIVENAASFGTAADDAANWAVEVFLARIRDTTAELVDLCDATESTVDAVFRNLDAAFCAVDDSAFRAPAGFEEICTGIAAPAPQPCPQPSSTPTTTPACATVSEPSTPSAPSVPSPTSSLAGLTCAGTGVAAAQTAGTAPTAPAGVLPSMPTPGVTIRAAETGVSVGTGGSLAIDGAVRAAGAIVGAVAEMALGIVGEVVVELSESVCETGSVPEPGPERQDGCGCDCECSCGTGTPEPEPPAPAPEPGPTTSEPASKSPEPAPEPQCPEPTAAAPAETVAEPAPEPECEPEPPAPAAYCVPGPEQSGPEPSAPEQAAPEQAAGQSDSGGTVPGAGSNPVRGSRTPASAPAPVVAGAVEPTLAEVGPPAPEGDDQGVALAEAGAM